MISVSQNSTLLGLDVHKLTISAAVLAPGADVAVVDKISSDPDAVRRLVGRFDDPSSLVACYEAGPTGYELARQLRSLGVRTEVVAPSMIPVAPGNRVKTDKRDARRLALLLRGGQLSAVRVPDVDEEAVRDLCRARADMVIDRTRARHRIIKFLLRHGRVWRDGQNWTLKHQAWICAQRFDQPALDATLSHYQGTLTAREAAVNAVDAELCTYFEREPFADAVRRLCAYRGVTRARCADLGHRGLRLAPVPDGRHLRRLLRVGALRELERGESLARRHHPCGQHPSAHPARRIRLGLQVPSRGRLGAAPTPRGPRP